MKDIAINVKNLNKVFSFSAKDENRGFISNLLSPTVKSVNAVNDVSFHIKKGERLAFIGPNGAGKSTTIKMLTGILMPSTGEVSVLGLDPQVDRKKLAHKIGTVFGQRSQMFPNLPITDSMYFFGVMYDMPKKKIQKRIEYLCKVFDLQDFKDQPVRKLSLGQRMRGEVACALMHSPDIIFLDEPTIGLDVVAKKSLRELLLKINYEEGTTIFLTSHDVGDIEALCERTIIINHGTLVKDLPTSEMTRNYIHEKYINIVVEENSTIENFDAPGIKLKTVQNSKLTFEIDTRVIDISGALSQILAKYKVVDINVYDVDLETVIREMYEATK